MTAPRYKAWQFIHPDFDAADGRAGFQVVPTGRIRMVQEDASVRQAILILLTTIPGERIMRRDYGCELYKLVFSPNDDTTAGLAIHYVRRALERWESRIDILLVDAGRDEHDEGLLNVVLEYRVRATQRLERLALAVDLAGGAN